MVAPALALAHAVDHVVDRRLHHLGRERGDQRNLVGHRARGGGELGARHDAVDEAVALGLLGPERLGAEEELLGLARPELPRFDQQLDADARHAQDRIGETGVVGGDDEVAHARQHEAGRRAGALHRRDRDLAEVADPHELVEVHGLLVRELAFGRVAQGRPVLRARQQLLQVVAGREVLALRGQDDHPHAVVGIGPVERAVELGDELRNSGRWPPRAGRA